MNPSDIAAFTPPKREHVIEMIVAAKPRKKIKWADVAKQVGKSKEWVTAGRLGQITFTSERAEVVGKVFELPPEAIELLQFVPHKGSLPRMVPTEPRSC